MTVPDRTRLTGPLHGDGAKGEGMLAALVGASDFEAAHLVSHRPDLLVAVDGGYAHLRAAGMRPDLVVGDFDSLGYVPDEAGVHAFPPEKDESDMELACRAAVQAGCDGLVLYGCLGGRVDHTLANLQVMQHLAREGLRVAAVGGGCGVAALHGPSERTGRLAFSAIPLQLLREGPYANFVSVFAWGGTAGGVSERGMKYGLEGALLPDDVSLGLSNELTGAPCSIEVARGGLVVTFPLAAWDYLRPGF